MKFCEHSNYKILRRKKKYIVRFDGVKTYIFRVEANSSVEIQTCDCKRDRLWVPFPLDDMKYL